MTYVIDGFAWLLGGDNWLGADGIGVRTLEHLLYTLIAIGISIVIAIPIGLAIGHTGRGRGIAVASTGMVRALPTLGLITLIALFTGVGLLAPMIAFVVLAVPSIIAGAYSGVEAVDRRTVDAARAQGMSEWQILVQVEIPLGLPIILGGIRAAVLQVVATATLTAYVGAGGLGRFLFLGLRNYDYGMMLGASIAVIVLAIILDLVFEITQRLLRRTPGTA